MAKRKGRPAHEFADSQRAQVKAMAGFGIPQEDIAKVIGCSPVTLRKHFRDELDLGATEANSKVAQSLYKKALGEGPGAVTAAIFWAKTRMGWRETVDLNHSGKLTIEKATVYFID